MLDRITAAILTLVTLAVVVLPALQVPSAVASGVLTPFETLAFAAFAAFALVRIVPMGVRGTLQGKQ